MSPDWEEGVRLGREKMRGCHSGSLYEGERGPREGGHYRELCEGWAGERSEDGVEVIWRWRGETEFREEGGKRRERGCRSW